MVLLFEITGDLCSKYIVINMLTHAVSTPYFLLQRVFKYLTWYTKSSVPLATNRALLLLGVCIFRSKN